MPLDDRSDFQNVDAHFRAADYRRLVARAATGSCRFTGHSTFASYRPDARDVRRAPERFDSTENRGVVRKRFRLLLIGLDERATRRAVDIGGDATFLSYGQLKSDFLETVDFLSHTSAERAPPRINSEIDSQTAAARLGFPLSVGRSAGAGTRHFWRPRVIATIITPV